MGETTIEWADYTFNPWIGCTKVSDGCKHCYAEVYGQRFGVEWGPSGLRRRTSKSNWHKPLAWNAKANREGVTPRVFCASLADVFEIHPQLSYWRVDLFWLIEQCDGLTWLLLTKRPENVFDMVPLTWLNIEWPVNVWIGTTVENQEMADARIPELLKIPAARRFLSCEPLLGPLDLKGWTRTNGLWVDGDRRVDWVICGGESGPAARPMRAEWARDLKNHCVNADVHFFFKQWGGKDKKTAGRILDGRTWDEVPK